MPVVAVGAIGAVVAALLALLVLYGIAVLARSVGNLVPNWHIPGLGNIRSFVIGAANSAIHALTGWLENAVGAAANFVLAPWHVMSQLYGKIVSLLNSLYATLVNLYSYARHIYDLAAAYAHKLYDTAIGYALTLYHQSLAYAARLAGLGKVFAHGLYILALAAITEAYAAATAWATKLYGLALHASADAYSAATAYAAKLYDLASAESLRLYHQALRYAEAVAATSATAAVGVLATDIVHVGQVEWVKIRDEVKALEGVLAADLPDIGAAVRAIDTDLPLDVAAVITGVLAIDIPVLRFLRECGVPNCKNLGKFGRDLTGLFGVVEGAALLAFLAAMIRDPHGAAAETVDTLDGVFTATVHAFEDLVGVG